MYGQSEKFLNNRGLNKNHDLNTEYFNWMFRLISEDGNAVDKDNSYLKLLNKLHNLDFEIIIPMDENRAIDGADLRYRFGYEENIDDHEIATTLDNRPSSVLEMMIALAVRCEEHIMSNDDIGDRTGTWFWEMISSLRLNNMIDEHFNDGYVETVISMFNNREYKPNGEGGLFTVRRHNVDLRNVEIWYQMHFYLNEIDE